MTPVLVAFQHCADAIPPPSQAFSLTCLPNVPGLEPDRPICAEARGMKVLSLVTCRTNVHDADPCTALWVTRPGLFFVGRIPYPWGLPFFKLWVPSSPPPPRRVGGRPTVGQRFFFNIECGQ